MTTSVTICQDPTTLSPESDEDDLLRYAENLGELLSEEFGFRVDVVLGSDVLSVACSRGLADEIRERVSEIQRGTEWMALAFEDGIKLSISDCPEMAWNTPAARQYGARMVRIDRSLFEIRRRGELVGLVGVDPAWSLESLRLHAELLLCGK